ncbi:MAG: type II secretion system major pseudopilin GspG [Nitrospira sp.]|nr:type II secretion system major pseudopilin GspG [bacterium]MBL7049525.1 type II secretion system major pseudopilin GspG [Nitrospira sp.]
MNRKTKNILRGRAGFTMIEIMVVMIILGLLAALVAPKMFGKLGKAKTNAAYSQIESLGTALDLFRLDVGRYPTTSEGLEALITQPSGAEEWNGPYLKKVEIPKDPWEKEYHYESPGTHGDYDLYTFGADNADGGEGENKDVVSWKGLK